MILGLCAALLLGLASIAQAQGDATRGAALAANRSQGLCVLCHALPGQPTALQGTIGPALDGVGARLNPEALRQRLLAPERFNPDTVMPSYGRVYSAADAMQRVPVARQGKPLLAPDQIDDLVAYLGSLK